MSIKTKQSIKIELENARLNCLSFPFNGKHAVTMAKIRVIWDEVKNINSRNPENSLFLTEKLNEVYAIQNRPNRVD